MQDTARLVLTQLAEERDSTACKAARLASIIEELRAEKKALLSKVTPKCISIAHALQMLRTSACYGAQARSCLRRCFWYLTS